MISLLLAPPSLSPTSFIYTSHDTDKIYCHIDSVYLDGAFPLLSNSFYSLRDTRSAKYLSQSN